jgi:hypothetical protein
VNKAGDRRQDTGEEAGGKATEELRKGEQLASEQELAN